MEDSLRELIQKTLKDSLESLNQKITEMTSIIMDAYEQGFYAGIKLFTNRLNANKDVIN